MTKVSPSLDKLAEPVQGKPVRIYVWKNGAFDSVGQEIAISPKALRSWNSILVYLTKFLNPVGAVRKLYDLETKKPVWCFDDLVAGGKYVTAGFEKLKFEDNAYSSVSDSRYAALTSVRFESKKDTLKAMLDTITYTQKKKRTIIYIMANGKSCVNPCKIVFIDEDLHDWDSVLQYMGHRLNVPEGIQYLCTVTGEIVFEPHQLCHGDLYIGVPFSQKFKKLDYVQMFHELLKRKKERKSYTPRKKGKPKPGTYAPWSVKNRKAPRISATILQPAPVNTDKGSTGTDSRGGDGSEQSSTRGSKNSRSSKASKGSRGRKNDGKGSSGSHKEYTVYTVTGMEKCISSSEKKSVNISGSDMVQNSASQTIQEKKTNAIKNKLGSVINACLDAVENYGFIEPQKTGEYHKARETIQDHIQQISARQVDNDYDESTEEKGTNLTTFAKLAQRNNGVSPIPHNINQTHTSESTSQTQQLGQQESEIKSNSVAFDQIKESIGYPRTSNAGRRSTMSEKSVVFEEKASSVDSNSTCSEIGLARTYSKKSLTEREVHEVRGSHAARGSKVPDRDSFELYKDKIWHKTASRSGLEKVPVIESNVNFVKGSSNEIVNKIKTIQKNKVTKQPSCCFEQNNVPPLENLSEFDSPNCCETILSASDPDVDELWKKSSAQSVEKSVDERPSTSENQTDTSRTTDTYAEHDIDSSTRNSLKVRNGSAPAISCCTSSKLDAIFNRTRKRHRLEYVSSDEDPFAASERRARGKNVLLNKDATIFGQLGSVVIRNNIAEDLRTPPTEGTPPSEGTNSKSSVRNKNKKGSAKDESIIDQLVKITADTMQNTEVSTVAKSTSFNESTLKDCSCLKVATQTTPHSKSQSMQMPSSAKGHAHEQVTSTQSLAHVNSSKVMEKSSKSSSRVRINSQDITKNSKIQPMDPITSCSEQSGVSKKDRSVEHVKTLYSDVSATPSEVETNQRTLKAPSKCFRQTCFSFGCSEICLHKSTGCVPCECDIPDDPDDKNE